ncbi:MAG TPA: hypothetical protein VFA07_09645 [Chthonomonadaceae bacterium]|nr:hypothetical protein [Chthonomonadaceae bacterium]
MRIRHSLYALALIALLVLSYFGWVHSQPAFAQAPVGAQPPRNFPPMMGPGAMMRFGTAQITANNSYVFILRGDIVYQLRVSDLQVVSQKELPAMDTGAPQNH